MLATVPAMAQNADETPIITFKTNIYDLYGAANKFHLIIGSDIETDYLDIDAGYGPFEAEIKPWTVDTEVGGVAGGTAIPINVSPEGIVKIYGDPKLVNYFYAKGCYLDWIDLDACTGLTVLELPHNELKSLDLSNLPNLYMVDLTDNTFSAASPLVIGKNHPALTILDLSITGWIDPAFSLSDYPALASFSGYYCQTLYNVDPSGCPNLQRLSLDLTPVSTLDVSKNPKLAVLNIADTRVTSIDLSKNPNLSEFYASHVSGFVNVGYKLSPVDLSNNPALKVISLAGNDYESIDLSKNPLLFDVNLSRNKLTAIDLSANPAVYNLDLSYNNLSFATLPFPTNNMGEGLFHQYYYRLNRLPVDRSVKEGTTLDFSDKILREGTETSVTIYSLDLTRKDEGESIYMPIEADPQVYEYADGKVTFHKALSDSVYVAFNSDMFIDAAYATTPFMVKSEADFGQPSPIVSLTPATSGATVSLAVGIDGATAEAPVKFFVDFGDGTPVEFSASASDIPATPNVTGTSAGTLRVLIPEGKVLSAFSIDGTTLKSIDVTGAREIRQLAVTNASLGSIDISYNRNLRKLDLTGNNLTKLDFLGVNGQYEKYMISDINLSHNKISELNLVAHQCVHHLDISYNAFTDFPSKDWDNLVTANLSHNSLTTANLAYFTSATSVDISGNDITSITLPETNVFEHFNCSDNDLTLTTLPMLQTLGSQYIYAPQQIMVIPADGAGANLSSQYLVSDGKSTVYTWKMADDNTTVGDDKIKTVNGISSFLDADLGRVYCEITHPLFPDFAGENIIKTSVIKTASKPDRLLAKFRTPVGGQTVSIALTAAQEKGGAVYIDWEGSQSVFEPYLLTDTYRLFEAKTVENAEVSVWTYGNGTDVTVFSITGATMDYFDGSGLDKAFAITLSEAELSQENIKLVNKENISELNLSGNVLTEFDPSEYPNMWMLHLDGNKLTRFEDNSNPRLVELTIGNNRLESVSLSLPNLYTLGLAGNNLTEIDLSGLPNLGQLSLSINKLSEIDLTKTPYLQALAIDRNYFTLETLPVPDKKWYVYYYNNQNPIEAECIDGKVDLSSQARVGETETEFSWYIGVPEFDENGELQGEKLYVDDEYTIDNGVTTFLSDPGADVMCVFTNSVFPGAYFYTDLLTVSLSGIDTVIADLGATVSVEGNTIHVKDAVAADGTEVALYNISGVRLRTAAVIDGCAAVTDVAPGLYILTIGNRAVKVRV